MPLCNFIQKTNLRPCTVHVREGHCGRHATLALTLPPLVPLTCEFHFQNNTWCGDPVQPGKRFCPQHYRVALRSSINLVELLESVPPGEAALFQHARRWRQRFDRGTLSYVDLKALFVSLVEREHPLFYETVHMPPNILRFWTEEIRPPGMPPEWWEDPRVQDVWNQHNAQVAQPTARPAETRLERLARDSQNVHTVEVVRQTREGEERLLSLPTNGTDTRIQIFHAFASRFQGDFNHFTSIIMDVNMWYNRTEVRVREDRLYARLLDGLWTLIQQQSKEIRMELVTRLWQEINESNGMCAEGHISRLMNVMVGFDDNFKPPVTQGQLLQDRLAGISISNISLEMKLKEARAVLEELQVPHDEQAVWLDAF